MLLGQPPMTHLELWRLIARERLGANRGIIELNPWSEQGKNIVLSPV